MSERIDHAQAGIEAIDKGLAEAEAITVETAVGHMVLRGMMDAEDALLILAAHERARQLRGEGEVA